MAATPHYPRAAVRAGRSADLQRRRRLTRVLVVDLDAKPGWHSGQVHRDAAAIRDLVHCAGGDLISDESPSGGIHLYIPFAQPISFYDARDLAKALAARTPSMDAAPNCGLTLTASSRPPGARHRSGGFQTPARPPVGGGRPGSHRQPALGLASPRRCSRHVELAAVRRPDSSRWPDASVLGDAWRQRGRVPRRGGARELAADYLRIATTGLYDTGRYPTPSHARQALLTAAVLGRP